MSGSVEDLQIQQEDQEDAANAGPQQAVPTQSAPAVRQQRVAPSPPRVDDPNAPIMMYAAPSDAAAPDGKGVGLSDYAKAVWQGTLGMGQQALAAASLVARKMGASPDTVQHIEQMKKAAADTIESSLASMSPDAQKAMHASIWGGQDANGEHIPTPGEVGWGRYLGLNAMEFVPPAALALLTRGLSAKLGLGIASTLAATGGEFGALQMGGAYDDLVKTVDQSKPEDWQGSPVMQQLLSQGTSFTDAKKQIVNQVAGQLGALQFGIGAITGAGASQLMLRGPLGLAGKALLTRLGLSAGEGAVNMAAQTGGGEAAQENATNQAGLTSGFDTGKLAHAIASGTLIGAGLGAGASFHGTGERPTNPSATEETRTPGPSTSIVSPEMNAALNTQLGLDLGQAGPGFVGGSDQGQLFRTTEQANEPAPNQPASASSGSGGSTGGPGPGGTSVRPGGAPTDLGPLAAQPTIPGTVEVGPTRSGLRASDGMKRQDLVEALSTMPGMDPRAIKRMTVGDLRDRYDAAHANQPSQPDAVSGRSNLSKTTPEPVGDLNAQASAVADPNHPKDAMFVPDGSPMPAQRDGTTVVQVNGGHVITTNPDKAAQLQAGPVDDTTMAGILGYTEDKQSAIKSGKPMVVQAKDAQGNVVHEQLASPQGLQDAQQAAAQHGTVSVTTPEEAQARRAANAPTVVDHAAAEAETPTPAQAEAGNYKKGHTKIGDLGVSIETPKGGVRKGIGPDGKPWEATMPAHYGYIRKTTGADGDHVDVTLGPKAHEAEKHQVYVIDQKDPATAKFDEHKAMVGYENPLDAIKDYDAAFSDGSGPTRRGAITPMKFDEFKEWAKNGDTKKAIAYKPTVSETLRAKRAAEKAKMAATGPHVRGEVATVELPKGETSPEVEAPARTPGEAVAEAEKAIRGYKVVPLKKGDDTTKAINQVIRELSGRLEKTKSEGDVHEAIAKWARSNPNPLPGTRTRRIEIGDHVMRLLTNKTVDEFSGRAERVKSEVALGPRPPSVYESEGAAKKADLEAAHARELDQENVPHTELGGEVSEGVQNTEGAASPEPTKIVDKLPWWLDRVRQGEMTVQEADASYGAQKSTGRPRQFKTFADYLDDQIRRAEDPSVAADLKQRLTQLEKRPTSQAKSAETQRINALLETTGKEAADKLRELRAELDPVKSAADDIKTPFGKAIEERKKILDNFDAVTGKQANPADVLRAKLAARKERKLIGSTLRGTLNDSRVNRVVTDRLTRDETSRVTSTLGDHLRDIANDEVLRAEAPFYSSLARRMLGLVKDDVPVLRGTDDSAGKFSYGLEKGSGTIYVNPSRAQSPVEALLHEGLHSITARYLDSIPDTHPDMQTLFAIGHELSDAYKKTYGKSLGDFSFADKNELAYSLEDVHELHTMLMTNPTVQRLAASVKPSDLFKQRMVSLGYPLQAVKSVWAAFTAFMRRAIGLKGLPSEQEATLFDHVLKPLQDITDRAAAFNRGGTAGERNLPSFKDARDAVTEHVDLKTMGNAARKTLLEGANADHMEKWSRPLFTREDGSNPLTDWRDAREAKAARSKTFNDTYADRVASWAKGIAGPERDKLASLLVDATTANVRLGPKADNSHLTTVGQQDRLKALQTRYDQLSAKAKASYAESVAIHNAMHAEEQQAQLNAMLKGAMPTATKAQLDAVRAVSKGKNAFESFLKDPDNSDIAAKFGAEWKGVRSIIQAIAKIHQNGHVQGDYFPLRRDGNFVLRYGDKGDEDAANYGVEMFHTISAAEARRAELEKQNTPGLSQVLDKRTTKNSDMISLPAIDEVVSAMKRNGMDDAQTQAMRDLMTTVALQHATTSSATRARARRQGVLGASTNVEKVAAESMLATSARVGYLEHSVDEAQALQRMRDHADELGKTSGANQRAAMAVVNEAELRHAASFDDGDSIITTILHKANTFGYVQSLMSFSHMLTSTVESHTNSLPLLGGRHGFAASALAIGKALKDSSPILGTGLKNMLGAMGKGLKAADWNLSTVMRDNFIKAGADRGAMVKLFDSLNKAGLIDHTFVSELKRIANPSGRVSGPVKTMLDKFIDMNSAGAHAVDVANKSAIAKAAFDLEYRKTGNVDAAVKYATQTARDAMPNYNAPNKARVATQQGSLGRLAAPITQFKMYGIHQYGMMANLAKAAWGGDKESAKAFAGIIATHMLMAGAIAGSPLGDVLRMGGGFYDFITGEKKPHDYENNVRQMLAGWFGPQAAELMARGLPHAAGIDIHRRVGLSNLLEPPELKSFDTEGMGQAVGQALVGASGEDAETMAAGVSKLINGDVMGFMKSVMPRQIRDVLKAYGYANDGVQTAGGSTVLPADKISTGAIIAQGLGFNPAVVSEAREGEMAVLEARDERKAQHSYLTQRWLRADPEDRSDIMTQIQRHNAANPGDRITISDLLQAEKRKKDEQRRLNQATFGLSLPKKAQNALSAAGSFANIQ